MLSFLPELVTFYIFFPGFTGKGSLLQWDYHNSGHNLEEQALQLLCMVSRIGARSLLIVFLFYVDIKRKCKLVPTFYKFVR